MPGFTLLADDGAEFRPSEIAGNLVLFFYPKDDTPGCTKECVEFSEKREAFFKLGVSILGISKNSVDAHKQFKKKHGLNIPLLSDSGCKIATQFGAVAEKSMFGRKYPGIERTTFLINDMHIIVKVWREVRVKGHVDAVLSLATALFAPDTE